MCEYSNFAVPSKCVINFLPIFSAFRATIWFFILTSAIHTIHLCRRN